MDSPTKAREQERRDWFLIPLILGLGFLCVITAGQWALRFSPRWTLNAAMDSNLDPNSDFLTRRPSGFIEPVDPAILTQPVWINLFLTPGADFSTSTPIAGTASESFKTPTVAQTLVKTGTPTSIIYPTNTHIVVATPTKTSVYSPPTSTSRPKATSTSTYTSTPTTATTSSWTATATQTSTQLPSGTATSAPTSTPTSTATQTSTQSSTGTPTVTATPTSTATSTSTAIATPTPTNTPDPTEPDFGNPDGNGTSLGNGASVLFNLSGFSLDGNSSWDMVYYEMQEANAAGKVHLGAVQIDVYDQTSGSWYTVYHWGDGIPDMNASYNNGNSEPDGFPVDQSLLYGAPSLNTGIALDIDTPAVAQGGSVGDVISQIRITSLSTTKCDVDAIQMLR